RSLLCQGARPLRKTSTEGAVGARRGSQVACRSRKTLLAAVHKAASKLTTNQKCPAGTCTKLVTPLAEPTAENVWNPPLESGTSRDMVLELVSMGTVIAGWGAKYVMLSVTVTVPVGDTDQDCVARRSGAVLAMTVNWFEVRDS